MTMILPRLMTRVLCVTETTGPDNESLNTIRVTHCNVFSEQRRRNYDKTSFS